MASPPEVPLKASSKRSKPHLSIATDCVPGFGSRQSPGTPTPRVVGSGFSSPRPSRGPIPDVDSPTVEARLQSAAGETSGPPSPQPIDLLTNPIPHPQHTPRIKRFRTNADQPKMRSQVANDMRNEIVETNWNSFKHHYMKSFPTEEELDTYLPILANPDHEILQPEGLGYKFKGKFSDVTLREEPFFQPLESVCDTVACVVKEIRRTDSKHANPPIHFQLVLRPHHKNKSSIDGGSHQMDGYFHSTADEDSEYTDHFTSVAVCAEFKKKDGAQDRQDVLTNRRQLVSGANYIMNNDPRRMFTFGITIEGEDCCVWYFSRSHTAKSKSFRWKDAHLREFIGTIIAFTFAKPEHLGFDPTITLIRKPKECFVYRIDEDVDEDGQVIQRSRFFKTEESISELHTTCITGRATRVWKAVEVKNQEGHVIKDAPNVVLKDVWLDENAQTERSIQNQIFDSIETFKKNLSEIRPTTPPEFEQLTASFRNQITNLLLDGNRYRDHFLTIITDAVSKPALPVASGSVHKRNLLHEGDPSPPVKASSAQADLSRASRYQRHPNYHRISKTPDEEIARTFTAKKCYRVVFEEVCSAIHCLTSFSEVMTAMEGALLAIFLLFAAGWVHRDISSGNILWYQSSGDTDSASRGILSDLEYAKKYPQDVASADPKTGTPYFMPCEILKGSYFPQRVATVPSAFDLAARTEITQRPKIMTAAHRQVKQHRWVKHNFAHDVESFFWVFIWVICTAFPNPHPELIKMARRLFFEPLHSTYCQTARQDIFTLSDGQGIQEDIVNYLDDCLSNLETAMVSMAMIFNITYTCTPVPKGEQEDCTAYKVAVSVLFGPAMNIIRQAKAATAPAIDFKPISELLLSEEAREIELQKAAKAASQIKSTGKRKVVDNPVVDMRDGRNPPPSKKTAM